MEPLNKAERSKAFLNFLLFFLITVAFVIAAVFFSIQVPFTENRRLTEQMRLIESERLVTQKFETNLNDVMKLLDDLNKKEVDATLTDGKIEEKIKAMNALIETDSSSATDPTSSAMRDLYTNVVANVSQYHFAKKEIRAASNKDANLSELKLEIANLKSELNSARQMANLYQMQAQMAANRSN